MGTRTLLGKALNRLASKVTPPAPSAPQPEAAPTEPAEPRPAPAAAVEPAETPIPMPVLKPEHVVGARLFADREQMISWLPVPEGAVIAEVGVARGDFSEIMLKHLQPKQFVAFDLFDMHEYPIFWGIPSEVLFEGLTHHDFYRKRFSDRSSLVTLEVGPSHEGMARYDDGTFDLIYIDAGHDYESVRRDAVVARAKLKDDGVLVFNDYIMYDHLIGTPYGIIQVVNDIVVNDGWHVVGFALQKDMFCDIAIQAAPLAADSADAGD